jgi:hypothetical protein
MRYCIEQARKQCGELVEKEEVFALAKLLARAGSVTAHLSASVQLWWFLIRFQLSDSDTVRFHRLLQAIDAIEMPSLHPLIDHIPNALSGYFCDGFVQGFLVSLGIADELSLALVLSLALR